MTWLNIWFYFENVLLPSNAIVRGIIKQILYFTFSWNWLTTQNFKAPKSECFQLHKSIFQCNRTQTVAIQLIVITLKIVILVVYKDEHFSKKLLGNWEYCLRKFQKLGSIKQTVNVDLIWGDCADLLVQQELHGFSDANFLGYGVYIYVKTINQSRWTTAHLLP